MSSEVKLPQVGFSVTEAILSEWLVADGAKVEEGMPIFSIETDKAVEEVESPAAGVIRISAETGKTYEVGAIMAVIE